MAAEVGPHVRGGTHRRVGDQPDAARVVRAFATIVADLLQQKADRRPDFADQFGHGPDFVVHFADLHRLCLRCVPVRFYGVHFVQDPPVVGAGGVGASAGGGVVGQVRARASAQRICRLQPGLGPDDQRAVRHHPAPHNSTITKLAPSGLVQVPELVNVCTSAPP